MKTTIKKFFGLESTKKVLFLAGFFLMIFCLVGFYCHYAKNHSSCGITTTIAEEKANIHSDGKCKQCGKMLDYEGYFCSANCRDSYATEYYGERYGKAKCKNCGKEFIKTTENMSCCNIGCSSELFRDETMIGEAEEYRKSKQSKDVNSEG